MISVLYVDDERNLLDIARLFLERSGEFRVGTSTSAQEALDSLSILSYDAIIADYQMPGMNGIAFLKVVRERYGNIPFILFTGRGREEVVIEAINNGADFYLQKGGDPKAQFAELAHKIRQAVRREQAERSLHDSERRLSDIIDFLPDATFAIDRSGYVIAWNRAIEEMTGVPSSDMLGKGDFEYAVPFYGSRRPILIDLINEPNEKILQFYSNIYRTGNSLTAETDLPHPKGDRTTVLAKVCPLYNQAGEITGAIESIRDITELKKTEQELRRSEERYRSVVNDQTEMITRFTPDGTITFTNEAYRLHFVPMLGLDEIVGGNIHKIIQAGNYEQGENFLSILSSLTPEIPIREIERVGTGRDGKTCWQRWSVRALFDKDGKPAEYQVVGRDITERTRAEENLRESEETYRDLVDLLPQMIFEMDLDFRVTYANRHMLTVFGFADLDPEHGINALSFIEPSQHAKVKENVQKQLKGIPFEPQEYTVLRKDGSTLPVIIYSAPIYRNKILTGIRGVMVDISARKKMEEELQASEEKFRKIFTSSALGMTLALPDFRFLIVNPAWVSMLGYTDEEFQKMSFKDITHPDDLASDIEGIRALGAGSFPVYNTEKRYIKKDGSTLWGSLKVTTIRNQYGDLLYYLAQIEDITPRKEAEEAARESEERLKLVMNGVPVLIAYMDSELRFVYINKAHTEWYGRPEEDLIGKSLKDLLPEDVFSRAFPYYQKVLAGYEVNFENPTRNRDGRERVLNVRLVPHVHSGQVVGFFAALEDITERKRMEEALRESEGNFHSMFENHDSIMLLIEPETGKIIDANRAAERFYGRTRKDLCSLSIEEINALPPEVVAAERAKAVQAKPTFFTFPHRTASGEIRTVEVHSSPIAMKGKPILFSIINDITERRKAGEALRQANKKLTMLSSITRHDILNQLTALRGYLELSKEKTEDPEFLKYIGKEDQAAKAIQWQIELARRYQDIGTQEPKWQLLSDIIGAVIMQLKPVGKEINVAVTGVEIFADPLLERVFYNLMENSLRHGDHVTRLNFSVQETENGLAIIYCDNGMGITAEEKKKLFQRGVGKHTGLGLFLSKEILSITGMTITENGEPGKGARFEIAVPKDVWRMAESGR